MGRVSKRKKIKSCDPFYKGPRANPGRMGDLPPDNDEDQPPPKSFLRFLRYNKQLEYKTATQTSSKTTPISTPRRTKFKRKTDAVTVKSGEGPKPNGESAPDDASVSTQGSLVERLGISTAPSPAPGSRAAMFVRRPGESTRSYLERIDVESKNRLVDCFRKERKKSNKRKEYMEERRRKLKSRKRKQAEPGIKDFNDFKDEVKFGEVVKAPPRLSAKPRGAKDVSRKTPKHELLKACSSLATDTKLSIGGLKRQKDVEEERELVIRKYREMKKVKLRHRTDD